MIEINVFLLFLRYLNQTDHRICDREGNSCFQEEFDSYQEDLIDRTECDCRSDCGGLHIFSSMNRYSFDDETATQPELWWNPQDSSGRLASYLLDPQHFLVDEFSKNVSKLVLNVTDVGLADLRFHRDISVLNFFFDTPIITQVKLEMKVTIFDQISAVGGTLGLFTGVSLISFVEVGYWILRFIGHGIEKAVFGDRDVIAKAGGKVQHVGEAYQKREDPINDLPPNYQQNYLTNYTSQGGGIFPNSARVDQRTKLSPISRLVINP